MTTEGKTYVVQDIHVDREHDIENDLEWDEGDRDD